MDEPSVLTGCEFFVLAVPLIGILLTVMFGVDERLFTAKRNTGTRRSFCEVGCNGESFFSDPDGQAWQSEAIRQVDATLIGVGRPGSKSSSKGSGPGAPPHRSIRGYIIGKA